MKKQNKTICDSIVICRQVQVVVSAGSEPQPEPELKTPKQPKKPDIRIVSRPDFFSVRFFNNRRIIGNTMWSSRNAMLTDNDGDDVAFLSGSGDARVTISVTM